MEYARSVRTAYLSAATGCSDDQAMAVISRLRAASTACAGFEPLWDATRRAVARGLTAVEAAECAIGYWRQIEAHAPRPAPWTWDHWLAASGGEGLDRVAPRARVAHG